MSFWQPYLDKGETSSSLYMSQDIDNDHAAEICEFYGYTDREKFVCYSRVCFTEQCVKITM